MKIQLKVHYREVSKTGFLTTSCNTPYRYPGKIPDFGRTFLVLFFPLFFSIPLLWFPNQLFENKVYLSQCQFNICQTGPLLMTDLSAPNLSLGMLILLIKECTNQHVSLVNPLWLKLPKCKGKLMLSIMWNDIESFHVPFL